MLVLTRQENESIIIGDDLTVTVIGIKDKKVTLAINKKGKDGDSGESHFGSIAIDFKQESDSTSD